MTERIFPHRVDPHRAPQLGLVVLQADETIEGDFPRLLSPGIETLVSRVPSGAEVTPETLSAMEAHLGAAAARMPLGARFAALAYACTSGAAQLGPARVAHILSENGGAPCYSDPVTALISACRRLGITRLALLSPYIATVSSRVREVLAGAGIETPVFGSFDVAEEARAARIDRASIRDAGLALAAEGGTDGLFLSCTNLRTLDLIEELEVRTGRPVLSSNQVLAWHMTAQTGLAPAADAPGRLFRG